jgi:hypothetical protein
MTVNDRMAFGIFMAEEQARMMSQLPSAPQIAMARGLAHSPTRVQFTNGEPHTSMRLTPGRGSSSR